MERLLTPALLHFLSLRSHILYNPSQTFVYYITTHMHTQSGSILKALSIALYTSKQHETADFSRILQILFLLILFSLSTNKIPSSLCIAESFVQVRFNKIR